jgi:hypothetical protein
MEIASAIEGFLKYCKVERHLSENTVQAYACDLADFRAWLASSTLTSEIGTETLNPTSPIEAVESLQVIDIAGCDPRRSALQRGLWAQCLGGDFRWRLGRQLKPELVEQQP